MYAPNPWNGGSSYSHFDEATYGAGDPASLMTPQIGWGESIHDPGAMALGLLSDIGWTAGYPVLEGCTDPAYCNYNPDAVTDDGSCFGIAVNWTFDINTDEYPEETTWAITDNSTGETVASGGPYADAFTLISESGTFCEGCYTFTINDSYGDGICCSLGEGSFALSLDGQLYASGGTFEFNESTDLCNGPCTDSDGDGLCDGDGAGACVNPPTIVEVVSFDGFPCVGGNLVSMGGSDFCDAELFINGVMVDILTSTTEFMDFYMPAGTGTVELEVLTPLGSSFFTVEYDDPQVISASPSTGLNCAGGDVVTLQGTNLCDVAVELDAYPVTVIFNDATTIQFEMPPGEGTAAISVYTPPVGVVSFIEVEYASCCDDLDSDGICDDVNNAPVADDQIVSTDEDTPKAITMTGSDIENSALNYTVVVPPSNGSLSGTGDSRTYSPNNNFNGSDSFTFRVNDGELDSELAAVTITVNPVNDAPVANDQIVTTNENEDKLITMVGSDVEGSALDYTVVVPPSNGSLSGIGNSRTYSPNNNYNGSDSFTFRVNDGELDSELATVTITVLDVDGCNGAIDECGVCNGPGAIYGCGCYDVPQGDCDCFGNQLDAAGVCGGSCIAVTTCPDLDQDGFVGVTDILIVLGEFGAVCEPSVFGCTLSQYLEYNPAATVNDGSCSTLADSTCVSPSMDGYSYGVVEIGDQCGFAENLRTTVYGNGDAIPTSLTDGEWGSTTSGATAVYGEDDGCDNYSSDIDACDEAQSLSEYGRLYNWYAVDDARGLCPSGWHVPTDGEWTGLEDFITSQGFSGTEGTALKSTYGWYDGGNGTDDFGFSALPGGYRGSGNGTFNGAGDDGNWWSSSPDGVFAWSRDLYYSNPSIYRIHDYPEFGFSVRCLRDAG